MLCNSVLPPILRCRHPISCQEHDPVRSILHVDMDAFFATIEQMDNPKLRGKPVLVGHDGPRGVVATASYEARPFGCHSAQPMAVAKRLCPQAIVVPGRHERYREISQKIFALLDAFSPVIEPLSIDEAFLDLTGTERLLGPAPSVAARLKERIRQEIGLTASVGVAPNKFLAKLASDLQKPDGLTVIKPEDINTVLPPLPVSRIWGIGPVMAARLQLLGIHTIGDLRRFPLDVLKGRVGDEAEHYHRLAHGLDDRPVAVDEDAKSIGQEQTFEVDIGQPEAVQRVLADQVEQVAWRLRKHGLAARCVTLRIRFGDFQTITRSTTLAEPTASTAELEGVAFTIFDRWARESFQPVRLIGMTASHFSKGEEQLSLFVDPQREQRRRVDAVSDAINQRFGKGAIQRGGSLE
jgi:DNA polymerase IV